MMKSLLAIACFWMIEVAAQPLVFSPSEIARWERKSFVGETAYELAELRGITCLKASADSSSSGFFYQQKHLIDEPVQLQWSWFGLKRTGIEDELDKSGDDFAARLYVVKRHWLPWKSQSLMYVWSHDQSTGSRWDSPYTGQVKIIALADASTPLKHWQYFSRNVSEDFEVEFGVPLSRIDAIAIMTDGDDAGVSPSVCYGPVSLEAISNQ